MALAYSQGMEAGTKAPSFSLRGVDEQMWDITRFAEADALVVVFTCNHCPYAKAVEDRLVSFQADYLERGVRLVAINPNDDERYPEDSFAKMKERAQEKHFNFPYLRDETQEVAKAYQAACTPDIFLFGNDHRLFYNGRFDDNWKAPSEVTSHDLRRAVDDLLAGKPLSFESVPSMGCSIKWRA